MRKLMWFTVGYAAGIAACVWLFGSGTMLVLAGLLGIASVFTGLLFSPNKLRKIIAACMVGVAVYSCFYYIYEQNHLIDPKSVDGQTQYLSATVTDYSTETKQGTQANAYVKIKNYQRFYSKSFF